MALVQQFAVRNRLLRTMSPEDFSRLKPHLEPVALQLREPMIPPEQPIEELLFVESGMVSITTAHNENRIEIVLIGREGLVGADPVLMHADRTPHLHFVQLSGEALSINRQVLCDAVEASPALNRMLLRHVHTLMIQISQTVYAHAALSPCLLRCFLSH